MVELWEGWRGVAGAERAQGEPCSPSGRKQDNEPCVTRTGGRLALPSLACGKFAWRTTMTPAMESLMALLGRLRPGEMPNFFLFSSSYLVQAHSKLG